MKIRLICVAAFLIAAQMVSASLKAQSAAKLLYHLTAVNFTGLNHFSQASVLEVAGLHPGDSITLPQLAAAADKLGNSGAFEKVSYRYLTRENDLEADFAVEETQKLLSCEFDNFVWFTQTELDKTLRLRVPLYAGLIPESGTTAKAVATALREMVRANGIPGDVGVTAASDRLGGPVTHFLFRVTGVSVVIQNVSYPGASATWEKDLRSASSQIIGRNFSYADLGLFTSDVLVPLYRQKGYWRAGFSPVEVSILSKTPDGSTSAVGVTISIVEGSQYRWENEVWEGNQVLASKDLRHLLKMTPGEIANKKKFDDGLDAVKRAYEARGYIDAAIDPQPRIDDATKLIHFEISVGEGTQYHFRQIRFEGFSSGQAKRLNKDWRLKSGDIFDETYAIEFEGKEVAKALGDSGHPASGLIMQLNRDAQNASVDVLFSVH